MALNEMDARLISQNEQVTSVEGTALIPVATAEGQPQKNIALSDLADSMGAQGGEVEDIKTLWGQTADGKMVQINKASIASVIGNLLYGADNKNDLASVVAGVIGYGRNIRFQIAAEGWYRVARLNSSSFGFVFASKEWSNGAPSNFVLACSGGSRATTEGTPGYVEKVFGKSNGASFFTKARVAYVDNSVGSYLELYYNADKSNYVTLTFVGFSDIPVFTPMPSDGSGTLRAEVDLTVE